MKAADLFVNYVCTMPRMLAGVVNSEISTAPATTASQYLTPYVPETHYSSGNESTGQKGRNYQQEINYLGEETLLLLSLAL